MHELKKHKVAIIISAIILIAAIIAVAVLPSVMRRAQINDQFEIAQQYLNDLDYENALLAFTKILEIDPRNEDARQLLQDTYLAYIRDEWSRGNIEHAQTLMAAMREVLGVLNGMCGDHAIWVLDKQGVLTISGEGITYDYGTQVSVHDQPWYEYRSEINKVVISNGITELGWYNFSDCANLNEVVIAESLTNLGKGTFVNCTSLEKIAIPDSVTFIGWDVFFKCSSLRDVKLSENLQHIGWHAFFECTNLEKIVIPASVSEIGKNCFKGCSNLKSVYFYGSVPTFVSGEFHETHSDLILHYMDGISGWSSPIWIAPDGTVYATEIFQP